MFLKVNLLVKVVKNLKRARVTRRFMTNIGSVTFTTVLVKFYDKVVIMTGSKGVVSAVLGSLDGLLTKAKGMLFMIIVCVMRSMLALLIPSSSKLTTLAVPVVSSLYSLRKTGPRTTMAMLRCTGRLAGVVDPITKAAITKLTIYEVSFDR